MDTAVQPAEHLLNRISSALRRSSGSKVEASGSKEDISLIAEVFQSHRSDGRVMSCREGRKPCICIVLSNLSKVLYRPAVYHLQK